MSTPAEELRDRLAKPEKPPRTIWHIGEELEALGELIAENLGEITPEMEAALDALEGERNGKLERIYLFAKDCDLNAEKAKMGKAHMAEQERYWLNKARGLRQLLEQAMGRYGVPAIITPRARFTRVQSQPKYWWDGPEDEIPPNLRRERTIIALDGAKVRAAVAAGEPLPSAVKSDQGWHITSGPKPKGDDEDAHEV